MKEKFVYDLAVVGGGVSGVACAYIASKLGLRVLLVEKNNYLGGLMTGGLVIPAMKSETRNLNQEFFNDLILFSKKYGAQIEYGDKNSGWFNPVLLKIVFEQMLKSVNCKILYETEIQEIKIGKKNDSKNIKSIKLLHKSLSLPIESIYYVDATGCGELAKLAKCTFLKDDFQKQASSLRFMMSNVDTPLLGAFLKEIDKDETVTTVYNIKGETHLSTAYTSDKSRKWALGPIFKKAVQESCLKEEDCKYFQIFTVAGMPSTIDFNCPEISARCSNTPSEFSESLTGAREAMLRLANFCKRYLAGFKNSYISNIADMTGVRECGRVKCLYTYKKEDIVKSKKFENPVLYSDYPIDIHSDNTNEPSIKKVCKYSLPIESLMSADYKNLFVTGRCLGAEFEAQAALRVQTSCMSMGEGVAKYIFHRK
jgi:hypothetical protein